MAYASYPGSGAHSEKGQKQRALPQGKLMARVFGYMALAVLITGAVAFGLAVLFTYGLKWTVERGNINFSNGAVVGYFVLMGVSFVALLIDSFVMQSFLATGKHSIWGPYIIYATLMGVLMSSFVMFIDLYVLVEAFGIATISFLLMFLIGYFSKADLNPLGLVAYGALFSILLLSLFWGLFAWLSPGSFYIWNLVFSIAICAIFMIIAAVDSYNIKKILQNGEANDNICLYCAFTMYSDFIMILIRLIYILSIIQGRRN